MTESRLSPHGTEAQAPVLVEATDQVTLNWGPEV